MPEEHPRQRIRVLDEVVANRIAAGEVVVRPASVVRELVDNALDAGAGRIEVKVEHGGKSLIRVTDDGCGMGRDDALLALERHATSKIRNAEDLAEVRTLGFRGEALPSIAAVGRFVLKTRTAEAGEGTEVRVDGGKLVEVRAAGMPAGTQVEVRSLFFHTPGRRKFLKSDLTEQAHVLRVLRQAALQRPDVAWRLMVDGQEQAYPAAGSLGERLKQLYGPEWPVRALVVSHAQGGMRLRGYVGRPEDSRADRRESHWFVNGRPVAHRSLDYALLEGWEARLAPGCYPVHVLFLELPGGEVDVNVHPAKAEVRFRSEPEVRSFIARAVVEAQESNLASRSRVAPVGKPEEPGPGAVPQAEPVALQMPLLPGAGGAAGKRAVPEGAGAPQEEVSNHDLRVIGMMLGDYVLAENAQGLVLVNLRAARERILFEELYERLSREESSSQRLLMPETFTLPPDEAVAVQKVLGRLQAAGFGVADLGGGTFLVDGLPPWLSGVQAEVFFREWVRQAQAGPGRGGRRPADEALARSLARQASRMLATASSEPEVAKLLRDLHACELPYADAEGRPTMILMSREELARKFHREP